MPSPGGATNPPKDRSNGLIDRDTKRPYTTREYERREQVWHYPTVGSESPSDSDIPYGGLNAHPARFPLNLARDHDTRDSEVD